MEIKGEEFLKKVQNKQEKQELEQRLSELKAQNDMTSNIDMKYEEDNEDKESLRKERIIKEDPKKQGLDDIMLDGSEELSNTNETDKKKYLILGLVLIILFLLTIVIIRLFSGPNKKEDSFSSSKNVKAQENIDNNDIEKQYQKILDEKLKNIKEQTSNTQKNNKEELNIVSPTPQKSSTEGEEIQKNENKEVEEDKEIENKEIEKTNKPNIEEVNEAKPILNNKLKVVKKVTQTTKKSTISGIFIQVGAFLKQPEQKYLDKIKSKFKYKIHKVTIKGKVYNKVLIGPYKSKAIARQNIPLIKKELNIPSAFILAF